MSDRPAVRVWEALTATSWAMLPERLPIMFEVAAREFDEFESDDERIRAVEARLGRSLDNAHAATVRDGVAVIPIEGVIFPRASLFTAISGGVSIDALAQDLTTALDNPAVTGIALLVDSPGGDVNGVAEFAAMVHATRGRKPIVAYVRELGASAAYWIAAAADEVVVASTALVGSIGIIGTVSDPGQRSSRSIEFVSSQSPHKRPDPTSQAGQARIQARVDTLADLFIADVARYRGVSPEKVASDFGQGDLLVGEQAVKAGLANRLGSFEGVVADLQQRARQPRHIGSGRIAAVQEGTMAQEPTKQPGFWSKFWGNLGAQMDADDAFTPAVAASQSPPPSRPLVTGIGPGPFTTAESAEAELAALRVENARMKAEKVTAARASIPTDAAAFADAEIRAGRALPAEHDALVGMYTDAATDDADYPRADQPTRVARLAERQGTRPKHALTTEAVPVRQGEDGALTVIAGAETTRAEGDPIPLDPLRYRNTLAHTATGRQILAAHGIPDSGPLSAEQRGVVAKLMRDGGLAVAN